MIASLIYFAVMYEAFGKDRFLFVEICCAYVVGYILGAVQMSIKD
jgi:hypothetical protein